MEGEIFLPNPGDAWLWTCAGGPFVINLLTQEGGYGEGKRPGKASASNVNHTLRALKKIVVKRGLSSVALPSLVTGVGGLDWEQVELLIQNQLRDLDVEVIIYKRYTHGQPADKSL